MKKKWVILFSIDQDSEMSHENWLRIENRIILEKKKEKFFFLYWLLFFIHLLEILKKKRSFVWKKEIFDFMILI